LALAPATVAGLFGDDQPLPAGALPIPSHVDLGHRLLLAAARHGGDAHALHERALAVAADALEQRDPQRIASGRPATHQARRAIVNESREALAADPDLSLSALARRLAVSPHHLSRVFRTHTGHTIARHRMLLRARLGLERISDGERDLTRLAADLGFSDQSHLCRVIRTLTGHTPSALRDALH
jgi:AraC-like DNA-binding protein